MKKVTYGPNKDLEAQLTTWEQATSVFRNMLDNVIKKGSSHPSRVLLGPVLKASRSFLDHFFKHGMEMMDKLFNRRREDCIALLKKMQQITRYLQHVCTFSKLKKDVALSNHVPLLKKTLETFVFRVKAMLAYNNSLEAFVLGNLKNRDLHGGEISSQITDDGDDDEEDEVQPEDQSDIDLGDDELENNEALEESLSLEY